MTRRATWERVRIHTAARLGRGCSRPDTASPTPRGLYLRVGSVAPTRKTGGSYTWKHGASVLMLVFLEARLQSVRD